MKKEEIPESRIIERYTVGEVYTEKITTEKFNDVDITFLKENFLPKIHQDKLIEITVIFTCHTTKKEKK